MTGFAWSCQHVFPCVSAGAQQHPRLYDGRIHVPLNIITAHFNNQEVRLYCLQRDVSMKLQARLTTVARVCPLCQPSCLLAPQFPVPIYTKVIINNEVVGDNVQVGKSVDGRAAPLAMSSSAACQSPSTLHGPVSVCSMQ